MLDVVMDAHDVRMVEFGQYPGLGQETGAQVGVVRGVQQDLDGDLAPDEPVLPGEYQAIAPSAEVTLYRNGRRLNDPLEV